jgi:LuxR family maltose regulon positive regulatory protein
LARLRARGQTVELRAADLRFTEPEAAQFLNDVMGLHLDAESVAMLEKRTEGWIAGLQMAALSMRDREDVHGFIEGFSGTNRYILDYLLEEILAKQSPEIQHFLRYTSILERLTAPLCDALLASDERLKPGNKDGDLDSESPSLRQSASILEYLERKNIFLVSLDDERIWFRYHHLFADLLKARLHQAQPDLVPHLHMRASAWLEQRGFIPEAIQHLFAAHEIDRAADLIERYGAVRWAESDPSVVQMAEGLPPEMLLTRPKVGLYQAWLLIIQGHIGRALPLLNNLAQRFADADPNSGQQWMQTIITLALVFLAPPASTPGLDPLPDDQVLDEVPADELILRDAADILYGMALARRGKIDHAAEISVKYIQREKTSHGWLTIPTLVPFLARIYLMLGRLQAAASLCHEFLAPLEEKGIRFLNSAGDMNIALGEVLYERNRLAEAEQRIRDGLQANEPWNNIMTDAFGLIALTRVLQARGDYSGAMQIVEKFEARLQGPLRPREFDQDLRTLRVRVQLTSGDLQSASQWANQVTLNEDFRLHAGYYRLTLARIRLAQSRYADVEEMLTKNSPSPAAANRITAQIESNLLLAAAIAGQGRLPEAFELIETYLSLAEPEGYIRVFLDVGEPARGLLAAYLRSDAPGHQLYARTVLDAYSLSGGTDFSGHQPAGLIEPLSDRELEVLQLMALGKTNQEIAQQLIVARGTIKAHAASIYRKLDVANRTEAVARARQLGILT